MELPRRDLSFQNISPYLSAKLWPEGDVYEIGRARLPVFPGQVLLSRPVLGDLVVFHKVVKYFHCFSSKKQYILFT